MTLEQIVDSFDVKDNISMISTEEFIRKAKKLFIGRSIDKLFDNQKIKEFSVAFTYNQINRESFNFSKFKNSIKIVSSQNRIIYNKE